MKMELYVHPNLVGYGCMECAYELESPAPLFHCPPAILTRPQITSLTSVPTQLFIPNLIINVQLTILVVKSGTLKATSSLRLLR